MAGACQMRCGPGWSRRQHLCLDKGYDHQEPREIAAKRHARAHARRWVVERTHSWLNRFRAGLIRWNNKPANDLAPLHFAFGIITWRHAPPG